MTKTDSRIPNPSVHQAVDEVITTFGAFRTLWALAIRCLSPKARPPDADQIQDAHIRKDVGLPPLADPAKWWWQGPF